MSRHRDVANELRKADLDGAAHDQDAGRLCDLCHQRFGTAWSDRRWLCDECQRTTESDIEDERYAARRINFYCPECRGESLERCFAVSKELWGWSDHCKDCGWRGHAPYWVDRTVERDDRPHEERTFIDYPNGQGTYD